MTEADKLEAEIMEKAQRLAALRKAEPPIEIGDYALQTEGGETTLSALFGGREQMLVIHNMGQACRYCTLWADGLNGLVPHLEDAFALLLVSKDPPDVQRRLAQDRGWRFRMASHGGGPYMKEQGEMMGYANCPGAVVYEKRGEKIFRRARTGFGPGDLYSPMWHLLALAGLSESEWTPQFHYWRRPAVMEDGGANLKD
ncbi:MAG TPA: hypothetical protein DEA40_11915 [Parvularcula sp.]|nr:hypothetical protein [Parvularcula sp.]HBS34378.1 hypothetical protein [Parvularcula sp.]